jgi:uncharacterized membrane protein YhaH (DUF805 family)
MAEAANPYQAPRAEVTDAAGETQPVKVFSTKGRIGRARYIAYGAVFYLVIWILAGVFAAALGSAAWVALVVGWLAILTIGFLLTIQRCHDFNTSGWLSLLVLVPLANFAFWFIPGTDGPNRWGPPTPPNSAWVIVGVCIVPLGLVFVGILAAVAIPAYQDYGNRAKVSEVIILGSTWRMAVAEHHQNHGKLPSSAADLGRDAPQGATKYGTATLGAGGVVTLTLSPLMGSLAEKTIVLRPDVVGTSIAKWDCTGGTLQPKYRPASCRAPS